MNAKTETKTEEQPSGRSLDLTTLRSMEIAEIGTRGAFVPATMAEAMEVAKLMATSNFVPPHLRGKPGDCLAVVMQARNWGADPYAVASKTYFVNDRMAYESQLVVAIINTNAPLDNCRLSYEFEGKGDALWCRVSAKLKGDPEIKVVEQSMSTITVRNSPLWKSSPDQQLGYYCARKWARRHCPEVLLGIYTREELEEEQLERQADGSYALVDKDRPAAPKRSDFTQGAPASREAPGINDDPAAAARKIREAEERRDQPKASEERKPDAEKKAQGFDLRNARGKVVESGMEAGVFLVAIGRMFDDADLKVDVESVYRHNIETVKVLPERVRDEVVNAYDRALVKWNGQ